MPDPKKRCVNLDWLEVYVYEDSNRYPCDADYFRKQGYFVSERDYGTRQYAQAFTVEDEHGDPFIEVRRAPKTVDAKFSGYVKESCNLRLVNRYCYANNPVELLVNFLLRHGYIFQRIFRIDICYDFTKFDSGDDPERFARRYINQVFRKVNQCKIGVWGDDNWAGFAWQSLKWGNEKSMVSTKLYDKTLELEANKIDKSYIRYHWWQAGLIDHPVEGWKLDEKGNKTYPHVWRVEFSMKSKARGWIKIEPRNGKKRQSDMIPHRLDMFDTKAKLWDRFEELAYHYFCFKHKEYKNVSQYMLQDPKLTKKPHVDLELRRKYDCEDKVLFHFNLNRDFYKLDQLPKGQKKSRDEDILRRRLQAYQAIHLDPKIRAACQTLLDNLTRDEWRTLTENNTHKDIEVLQRTLACKLSGDERDICEIAKELREVLDDNLIWRKDRNER